MFFTRGQVARAMNVKFEELGVPIVANVDKGYFGEIIHFNHAENNVLLDTMFLLPKSIFKFRYEVDHMKRNGNYLFKSEKTSFLFNNKIIRYVFSWIMFGNGSKEEYEKITKSVEKQWERQVLEEYVGFTDINGGHSKLKVVLDLKNESVVITSIYSKGESKAIEIPIKAKVIRDLNIEAFKNEVDNFRNRASTINRILADSISDEVHRFLKHIRGRAFALKKINDMLDRLIIQHFEIKFNVIEFTEEISIRPKHEDVVVEQLKQAIEMNPSDELKKKLEQRLEQYVATKKLNEERAKQAEIDLKAERVLLTVDNFYMKGDADAERIDG